MNEKRLNTIFENYMAKFDYITYSPHEEIYKWEIAHDCKSLMDAALSSPPKVFLEKIKQIVSLAGNLLSNQYELPGGAICAYIEKDIENGTDHMRQLLSELLSDDNGDLDDINKVKSIKDGMIPKDIEKIIIPDSVMSI